VFTARYVLIVENTILVHFYLQMFNGRKAVVFVLPAHFIVQCK
jgi:hypothetical protein